MRPRSHNTTVVQSQAHLDVVGVLVIVGGVEDDLGSGLGADITGRDGLSHVDLDLPFPLLGCLFIMNFACKFVIYAESKQTTFEITKVTSEKQQFDKNQTLDLICIKI